MIHLTWQLGPFKQAFDAVTVAGIVTAFFALMYAIGARWVVVTPSPFALALGGLTYPLYLLHNEIGKLFLAMFAGSYASKAAGLFAAVIAMAYGIHRLELLSKKIGRFEPSAGELSPVVSLGRRSSMSDRALRWVSR